MRLFIEPTEPLLFRTGRPFDAGEANFAESIFPPTPETWQGAIRAAIAANFNTNKTLAEVFQHGTLEPYIGNRRDYGSFRITGITLGRRKKNGTANMELERLFPMPSHLLQEKEEKEGAKLQTWLVPEQRKGVHTDLPYDGMYLLYTDKETRKKLEPMKGWLTEQGLVKVLHHHEMPVKEDIVQNNVIFETESRMGIGMTATGSKTTEDGLLYQVQMVRMNPQYNDDYLYSFVVDIHFEQVPGDVTSGSVTYADDTEMQNKLNLPDQGWLTLGGERRAAKFQIIKDALPSEKLEQKKRGRLLYLATPAALNSGWQPKEWKEPSAIPITAAINRYQSIGGWLLKPGTSGGEGKPIRRCVPAGSVYFFEQEVDIPSIFTDYGREIGYGISYAGEWKI